MISQTIGLLGTFVLLGLANEAFPTGESVAWAAAAGATGVIGLAFFYYALSRGTMGIVAPLAALIGAGLPVFLAIVGGEHVAYVRIGGIGLALLAVVLISLPRGERVADDRRPERLDLAQLGLVVLAGLGFAGFFLFSDRATANGETWWPLVFVRVVGLAIVVAICVVAASRLDQPSWRSRLSELLGIDRLRSHASRPLFLIGLFALTGLGDLGGNAFFLLAKHADAFSVAVVLSSLYPVITTLLAAAFLHERLRMLQVLGVVLATASVPLLR